MAIYIPKARYRPNSGKKRTGIPPAPGTGAICKHSFYKTNNFKQMENAAQPFVSRKMALPESAG
jgi:hypothetical protein